MSIRYKQNPNCASLLGNAFWNGRSWQSDMHREENGHVLPMEQENLLAGCSPPPYYRVHSASRMTSRAEATRLRRLKSSTRANVLRCVMSRCFPVLSTRSGGIKHRGHGQRPRFRILVMRILRLQPEQTWITRFWGWYVLLTIISGIYEYTKIEIALCAPAGVPASR